MDDKGRQQNDSNRPKDWTEIVQEFRIGIDPVLAQVDLQVPGEMSENVEDKKKRGDGHDIFFANRRLVEGDQGVLGKLSGTRGGESRYRHSGKISRISHVESTLACAKCIALPGLEEAKRVRFAYNLQFSGQMLIIPRL